MDILTQKEVQDENFDTESDLQVEVDRFGEAVIWGTDWTTETIARQLEKGAIDLTPRFQRRDAWSNREKSKLIESLMLGLPVPPIILAENKEKRNTYIVIDGKQRLLSIRRFFAKREDQFDQLKLSGLDILTSLNGDTYEALCEKGSPYINSLENQPIRTVVIKNWPDDAFLYTVFLRLNTGSKVLSPQELRQALIPGPFLDYLDEKTADSCQIKKMLGNNEPDSRMKDVELALRYYGFAYYLDRYNGNLKWFLDDACRNINASWNDMSTEVDRLFNELENAIDFSYFLFQNESPFSRYEQGKCNNRFNVNIFELFAYYFSQKDIREYVDSHRERFREIFVRMNDDSDFLSAVSGTTKDIHKMKTRFNSFWNVLKEINEGEEVSANYVDLKDNTIIVDKRRLNDGKENRGI